MVNVGAINEYGYSVDFAQSKDLTIIDIDGLHPIKSAINSSPIPGYRGSLFNSISYENRNIVLSVVLNDYSSNGRNVLNQVFSAGSKVTLSINNYNIDGYVESNEYNPFNSKIISQISIVCLQPYFYNNIYKTITITDVDNTFSFPFSISSSGIALGNVKYDNTTNVVNLGDVPCGCIITAIFKSDVDGFVIYNEDKNQEVSMQYQFEQDDILTIDTRFASKRVIVCGPSTLNEEYDALSDIYNITNWIEIDIGNNMIGYSNFGDSEDNKYIDVNVRFSEMVGGL